MSAYKNYGGLFDVEGKEGAARELEEQTLEPDFWQDREAAQAVINKMNSAKEFLRSFADLQTSLEDAEALLELAREAEDEDLAAEAAVALRTFSVKLQLLELSLLLSGEYDDHDAIMALHAGAGGLEAQDWAEMLLRMFTRYAERRGYKVELLDSLPADEGGVKSATISVRGANAYGYLKSERGVHRLVRISPYDAAGRRHTSFASVDVMPQVADDNEVAIDPDDLRVDTYRSSGKGGQHLNKTDSAVRITHIPSGIVVQCQDERSQLTNKDKAMRLLKAKLLEQKIRAREAELAALRGEQQDIGWGSQIRSYVFQPYRLVKDHRTGVEVGNTDAVMDGEIDGFIEAYLRKMINN
jgi:peptide chain release factor 2